MERRLLRGGPLLLEIPITAEDRGGLVVRLHTLRDHQNIQLDTRIEVPWSDRSLELAFSTFRDRLRPGRTETFRITVKGADGRPLGPGDAEVLAYMFDRSLEIFAAHDPPDPRQLYPSSTIRNATQSPLGTARSVWYQAEGWHDLPSWPHLQPARLKFYDGWPIGGPGVRGMPLGRSRDMMARSRPAAAPGEQALMKA